MTTQTRAIGLMSGTSLDGIDAAWLQTDGERITQFGPAATLRYEDDFRLQLRRLLDLAPTISPDDPFLAQVEERLTRDHALAIGLTGQGADIIGFHGQTILHQPEKHRTWQIGDAALLARIARIPVVHDFRAADVAAGGQGAPFAPLFHAAMAANLPKPLLIVNIGGVANITYLGENGEILACDTGPGNGPLDDLAQKFLHQPYDKDGAFAASGKADAARLAELWPTLISRCRPPNRSTALLSRPSSRRPRKISPRRMPPPPWPPSPWPPSPLPPCRPRPGACW